MFRQTLTRNVRLFSTNVRLQKSAVDSAKDGLKSIDRTVSDKLVKGINKGCKSMQSIYSAKEKKKDKTMFSSQPLNNMTDFLLDSRTRRLGQVSHRRQCRKGRTSCWSGQGQSTRAGWRGQGKGSGGHQLELGHLG